MSSSAGADAVCSTGATTSAFSTGSAIDDCRVARGGSGEEGEVGGEDGLGEVETTMAMTVQVSNAYCPHYTPLSQRSLLFSGSVA